jgi:uncharacterized membrane-anchored protein
MDENPYSPREVHQDRTFSDSPKLKVVPAALFLMLGILSLLMGIIGLFTTFTSDLGVIIVLITVGIAWIYSGLEFIRENYWRAFSIAMVTSLIFVTSFVVWIDSMIPESSIPSKSYRSNFAVL